MRFRALCAAALVLTFGAADAFPQALTSLSSVRVRYNTRKNTANPQGELKAQIDAIDREIAEASRRGHIGEVRRLYAKGTALLAGQEWTDALEYGTSLVLRSDRVVVDSSKPYVVRLEQIYRPALELAGSLTATASLRRAAAGGTAATAEPALELVKPLGSVDGVSRDLNESPLHLDIDLAGVSDGTYTIVVDVAAAAGSLGTASLPIVVRRGLDDTVARLEAAAARAPAPLKADILYPVDRMKHVNRGRLTLSTFDASREFAAAEAVAGAVRDGKDPFAGRVGDFERHYLLESAGEIMPYRLHVPTTYTPRRAFPLIVALHGLGGTEDSFFSGYNGAFPKLAEERGYILAAPMGYRVDGGYGWGVGNPPADPAERRRRQNSEDDVMQVLKLVREHYNVDANRIYLMGHSMGGIGTWTLAPKYPDIWAALGPVAGSGSPATLERIRHIPQIVVHGDADATVNVRGSRAMVARMKELGMKVQYIEVPGGSHSGVVAPNAKAIFDFFDTHTKQPR